MVVECIERLRETACTERRVKNSNPFYFLPFCRRRRISQLTLLPFQNVFFRACLSVPYLVSLKLCRAMTAGMDKIGGPLQRSNRPSN